MYTYINSPTIFQTDRLTTDVLSVSLSVYYILEKWSMKKSYAGVILNIEISMKQKGYCQQNRDRC